MLVLRRLWYGWPVANAKGFLGVLYTTGKLHRLERCFLDWTTAVIGEADMCQPYLPQHWSNLRSIVPIYEVYR